MPNKLSGRNQLLIHAILVLGALMMIGPFFWMVLTSLKSFGEATHVPPVIFPHLLHWDNYTKLFKIFPFWDFYKNTVVSTLFKTAGQLIFCSMAAYALARIPFPGKNIIFAMILSVFMVPHMLYLLPQYLIMIKLGWVNTLKGLIAPGLFSAFGTFLLRQFFLTLPRDLGESAKIDGCNHFQTFLHIMLPLAKPGLIALGIFTTLWSWNDLLWPLIIVNSPEKMVLSVGLATLQGEYMTDFPALMAGAVLSIAPMIVLFMILQRQFIEGIALTGMKG